MFNLSKTSYFSWLQAIVDCARHNHIKHSFYLDFYCTSRQAELLTFIYFALISRYLGPLVKPAKHVTA